jgi:flagellar hook-length control protein FliK
LLPGLPFKWEITQKDHPSQGNLGEDEQSWQSMVRFELPHLGVVAATINLHGGQLQLLLRSDTDTTVAILKEYASTLSEALTQSGTALDFLSIKRDE